MGTRIGAWGLLAAVAAVTANAQPHRLGWPLSIEFLAGLVQARLMPSQVAIINANVGSATILDREVAGAVVFLNGAGNSVRFQIAEQLSASVAQEEPMHLKIEHRSIDVASCPAMIQPITQFMARLDAFDPRSIGGPPNPLQEILVDSTAYLIITSGRDAVVTIKPNGAFDPPLQQAAGRLHSAVSRCAGSVIPQVEQHDF